MLESVTVEPPYAVTVDGMLVLLPSGTHAADLLRALNEELLKADDEERAAQVGSVAAVELGA